MYITSKSIEIAILDKGYVVDTGKREYAFSNYEDLKAHLIVIFDQIINPPPAKKEKKK